MTDLVWLIPVFPLIGFLVNGLFGRNFSEKTIGWIGAGAVGASFVVTVLIFLEVLGMPPDRDQFKESYTRGLRQVISIYHLVS